jgi:hypothetical protein
MAFDFLIGGGANVDFSDDLGGIDKDDCEVVENRIPAINK